MVDDPNSNPGVPSSDPHLPLPTIKNKVCSRKMYNLNQQTFIELLVCAKHQGRTHRDSRLDCSPQGTSRCPQKRSGRQSYQSIIGLLPSVVSGNGRVQKETPQMISKTQIHMFHVYKTYVQNPHNYRCVYKTKLHMCCTCTAFHVQSQSPCVHRTHGYGTRTPSAPATAKGQGWSWDSKALSRLGLVLALRGCEEVIQNTSKVVKRGPVLWTLLPAQHHEVVQLFWTVVRSYHSVASLQILNYFRVGHP